MSIGSSAVLAGLALMLSSSIGLQILACAIYNNWWPMLSALMYVMPLPCLLFGGESSEFLTTSDGGESTDWAKFMTGVFAVWSVAIPIILRHANIIETGAMFIDFMSFFTFVCTILCFLRASQEDDW